MSTTIYLIRHGQSLANAQGIFLGQGDLDLSQLGIAQACKTADYLKNHVGRPDAIYASDLKRAYNTGKATADQFAMPITKDQNLREIDAGKWCCVPFSDLQVQFPETYSRWMHDIGNSHCDGGESVAQLQNRVVGAVTRIAKAHENSTVFLFTHATPIRVFAAHCLNKTLDGIKDIPWGANASVTKVIYHDGAFQLTEYSRDDFMQDLVTALPANV